jgi:hypothetical protein
LIPVEILGPYSPAGRLQRVSIDERRAPAKPIVQQLPSLLRVPEVGWIEADLFEAISERRIERQSVHGAHFPVCGYGALVGVERYAWLTRALDVDEGGIRLVMLASMGAMLFVALAVPCSWRTRFCAIARPAPGSGNPELAG